MSLARVHLHHLRSVAGLNGNQGYCLPVSRAWCERNGIAWRDFCRNGVSAEQLLATGDALAARLVGHAQQQSKG